MALREQATMERRARENGARAGELDAWRAAIVGMHGLVMTVLAWCALVMACAGAAYAKGLPDTWANADWTAWVFGPPGLLLPLLTWHLIAMATLAIMTLWVRAIHDDGCASWRAQHARACACALGLLALAVALISMW